MIKHKHLKLPLFTIFILVSIAMIFALAILIMQPLTNYIGMDWGDQNKVIEPNDGNGDQAISCPDEYLTKKVKESKRIYTISYSMAIINFLCSVILCVIMLVGWGFYSSRQQITTAQNQMHYQNRQYRTAISGDFYDDFFKYELITIIFLLLALAILAAIVNSGLLLSMLKVYQNCQGKSDPQLIILIIMGFISLFLLFICLLMLQCMVYRHHQYLDKNSEDSDAVQYYGKRQYSNNMPAQEIWRSTDQQEYYENSRRIKNRKNNLNNRNEDIVSSDLNSSDRLQSRISDQRNRTRKVQKVPSIQKQPTQLEQSIVKHVQIDKKIESRWVDSKKQIPENLHKSKRPVPFNMDLRQDDKNEKISHIDIFSQYTEDNTDRNKRLLKDQVYAPSRRKNHNFRTVQETQKADYKDYIKRRK